MPRAHDRLRRGARRYGIAWRGSRHEPAWAGGTRARRRDTVGLPMDLLALYRRLAPLPLGRRAFTRIVEARAPYFRSIGAEVVALDPARVVVRMRKRRGVENHIGTVHAIAMCNMAELAGGLLTQVNVPAGLRWIPSAMTVRYDAKATTDLEATSESAGLDFAAAGDVVVPVVIRDATGLLVFRASITMCVRPERR